MKRFLACMVGLMMTIASFGETGSPTVKSFSADPINHPQFPLFVISVFSVVVLLLVIVVIFQVVRVRQMLDTGLSQPSIKKIPAASKVRGNILFSKWHLYACGAVLVGVLVFISSKVITVSGEPTTTEATLVEDVVQPVADESPIEFTNDAATIEKGKAIFQNNCAACHRNDGGGNTIGPNLTDEFWLHGADIKAVHSTIKNGVGDKGMPAWGKTISADDVRDVAVFVVSLKGTNPPDAKAPQGEKY